MACRFNSSSARRLVQRGDVDRLEQVGVEARVGRRLEVLVPAETAEGHGHHVAPLRVLAHLGHELDARHAGQAEVGDDDVRRRAVDQAERFLRARGGHDLAGAAAEDALERLARVGRVLDQQDASAAQQAAIDRVRQRPSGSARRSRPPVNR